MVLLDNFCNSNANVLGRLQKILSTALPCIDADVRDTDVLERVLREYKIDAVIHFAGLKAIGESVEKPIEYYANNIQGTISLLQAMKLTNVKTLVFSSSATVYGDPQYLPIDENHPTSATNPYGRSKLHIEEMLKDFANSETGYKIVILRYFNPVGAHPSGLIGEDPNGLPNNLMPCIAQVAAGKLPYLKIYGNDYSTPDGTGVRDFIHVMDVAEGHLAALSYLDNYFGCNVINLGTGRGQSALKMIQVYEASTLKKVPYKIAPRRVGDIASCYADVSKARALLGWVAKRSLEEMCISQFSWINISSRSE